MIRSPIRGGGSGSGFALVPGATGIRLVAPGSVSSALTFTRSQISMFSTAFGADGVTLQTYGANAPRFNGTARRLLMEPQASNEIAQPNNFGVWTATIGGNGTTPTLTANYGLIAAPDGTFTATRLQADAGASGFSGISLAVSGSARTTIWVRTLAGTATLQIGTTSTVVGQQATVNATWQRVERTTAGAHRVLALSTVAGNSTAVDLLIWGANSTPSATIATTTQLPATTGATLRGGDSAQGLVSALFPGFVGTIIIKGMLPFSAGAADQVIGQVHDGSDSNRIRLRNVAGGNTIVLGHVIGGSAMDATTLGSMTPGAAFKAILTFGGGRVAGLLDGGTVQAISGQPSGLTAFDLANNVARTAPTIGGEYEIVDALPYIVPDVAMQSVLTATP